MIENGLEVKQSKKIVVFSCLSAFIFLSLFCGLLAFVVYRIITGRSADFEEITGNVFMVVFCAIVIAIITGILVYIIVIYKIQTDIYTKDRIIRKLGNRVVFELLYENIISIKERYESVFFVLKKPIKKVNGKKGPRNFYEHYDRTDIAKIKRIITDNYYNIQY